MTDPAFTGRVITGKNVVIARGDRQSGINPQYFIVNSNANAVKQLGGWKPGDVVQYGDNYYLLDASGRLSTETNSQGVTLAQQSYVTSHHPRDYTEAGYNGNSAPPPNINGVPVEGGVSTGVNSIYNPIDATQLSNSKIKVSQTNSLTGGGLINNTGRGPSPSTVAGIYTGGKGEQVIIRQGPKATSTAEFLQQLPTTTNDKRFQYQGSPVKVFYASDPSLPNASTPYDTLITILPTKETRASYLARTDKANYESENGNILKVKYSFVQHDGPRDSRIDRQARGGDSSFLDRLRSLPATQAYLNARQKIVDNERIKAIEGELHNIAVVNLATIDQYDIRSAGELNLNPLIKNPASRFLTKIIAVYPAEAFSKLVQVNRETPETLPLAYGAGKVAGFAEEAGTYLSSRYAITTASEPLLIRTSTEGIAKGIQAIPYAAGAAIGVQSTIEFLGKSELDKAGFVGENAAIILPFAAGDLSVRGSGVQAINKAYIKLSGAEAVPLASYAEPAVISGAECFSTIPRGDLEANKAAFEAGNFEVIHATRSEFPQETVVQRGTSKQAGLYVSPKGQAQLYFLGLENEPTYSLGAAKTGTPQLIETKLGRYSEELKPILKLEGQRSTAQSDLYLREHGQPDTAYLESRTYFGETPEVQAVIAEGTPLIQIGLETPGSKFFGFSKYTTSPEGTIIPIKLYETTPSNILNKGKLSAFPTEGEYSRSKIVDPYRAALSLQSSSPSSEISTSPAVEQLQSSSVISTIESPRSYAPSRSSRSQAPNSISPPPHVSITPSASGSSHSSHFINSPSVPSIITTPSQVPSITAPRKSPTPTFKTLPPKIPIEEKPHYPKPKTFTITTPLFDVEVRRRGEFQRVSTQGLRLEDAAKLGERIADNSAAASFTVVEHGTGQPVTGYNRSQLDRIVTKQFRPSKNNINIFVERNKFRINTPGEKSEIRPHFIKQKAIGGRLKL